MSAIISGKVWELDLPHSELLVLLSLADHANHDGRDVYPSIALTAWKTGYEERQVRRIIRRLLESGLLVEVSAEKGKVKTYRIDISAGRQKPRLERKNCAEQPRTKCPHYPGQNVRTTPDILQPTPDILDHTPDIAMSDEPLIRTVIKPSEEHSRAVRESFANPDVAIFIEEWCEDYRQQFGKPYVVSGAKDGAAIKRLLASTGLGPYELMEVAHRAWACPEEPKRFFWCPKANTIAIFASRWNEITSELDKAGKFAHKGEQQHADLAGVTYGLS